MTNPFADQAKFMTACDQSVGEINSQQFGLYKNLIAEEFTELQEAKSQIDQLDALIDILVVTIGAIHSMGQTERVHGTKSCVPTLPRSTKRLEKFVSVKTAKFSSQKVGLLPT